MTIRVFLTAPNLHRDAIGEEHVAWQWAKALSDVVELTVFSFQRKHHAPLAETLPNARVLTAPMPSLFARWERFEAMAKPHYPAYMNAVRRALRPIRNEFDIAHQIMPQGARYPCPLLGMELPFVIGPLGGALSTPPAFRSEASNAAWFTRLRGIDGMRFKYDPWLRASYSGADLVLGVAPYVADLLTDIPLKRFVPMLELGISDLSCPTRTAPARSDDGTLNLLHVGRGVRTKGLRDAVRAVAHLKDALPGLKLTSAGAGEDIELCRQEAETLGIADRVRFLGQVPRDQIEALYAEADIFVFPSFREPAGNVLYEAMRWGLPVITAARGGPNWIVDDKTGVRIRVTTPERYARNIAAAIQTLATDPDRRQRMGDAAREKLANGALWSTKADTMAQLYREVREARRSGARVAAAGATRSAPIGVPIPD